MEKVSLKNFNINFQPFIEKTKEIAFWRQKREETLKKDGQLDKNLFLNFEGGDFLIEGSNKLLAYHVANYAAVYTILEDRFWTSQNDQKSVNSLNILEFGCGSGVMSKVFRSFLRENFSLLSTDYNFYAIDYAKKVFGESDRLRFETLDILKLKPKILEDIDFVFACELWEHLREKEQRNLLAELYQYLPKGVLITFSTPDLTAYGTDSSGYYAHKKEYTFKSLKDWLSKKENNPFGSFFIYRLINPKLAADLIWDFKRGGFLFNRIYKKLRELPKNSLLGNLRKEGRVFLEKIKRKKKKEDLPLEYFDTEMVKGGLVKENKSSFAMVFVLNKSEK